MFKLTTISIVLFITTLINFLVFHASWQKRKSKGGYYFSFAILATAFWVLAAAFDYAAVPIPLKVFFAKLETLFYNPALILFFVFFATYAGYDHWLQKKWVRALLWIIPVINILLPFTNDWHNLYWSGFSPSPVGDNVVIFHHGPAFAWVAISGYLILIIMLVNLVKVAVQSEKGTRRQALVLILALFTPLLSNLLYLISIPGLEGIDWSSIFFSLSGLLLLIALYGTRLLDIAPVARNLIVDRMTDPFIVLDSNQNIVDINQAASTTFEIPMKVIGKKAKDVFSNQSKLFDQILSNDDQQQTIPLNISTQDQRYFDIDLTILKDHHEKPFAKLFVFRNITERYQANLEQKKRLEEIQALNEKLRSAQDIVIEQARTLAKVEERERLGRDLHDSVNQSIHSVMLSSETLMVLLERERVDEALKVAERIQEGGRQALKEIRLLLYEISNPLKDQDANFIELIEERFRMVERRVGIQAEISVLHQERLHCSHERIENIYWLTIEALNNVLKHAQANKIQIVINCTEEHLIVEIKDNGIGFDPDEVKTGGLGKRTMRERASLLDGELEIESAPNGGTTVRFWTTIEE